MIPAQDISVVIPAFNEANSIGEIIARINTVLPGCEIVVVDDCSTDDTAERAEAAGARVKRHPYNLGNGSAVKSGALTASREYLVFMDGDGQHPPEEIPHLVEHLGTYDLVVGARTGKSATAALRNIGNWGLIRLAQWISGHKIDDLTSGFRAVKRAKFLEFYHLYPDRYSYPTTITIAMFKSGYYVKYVPMDSISKREQGSSNISPFKDGFRFINIMLRTIMVFAPQRVFLPVSGVFFLLGMLLAIYQFFFTGGLQSASVILLVNSVFVFLFGLVAEQISQLRTKPDIGFKEQQTNRLSPPPESGAS